MRDDELAALPYADLWLSELGPVVPQHRDGDVLLPARRTWESNPPDPSVARPSWRASRA